MCSYVLSRIIIAVFLTTTVLCEQTPETKMMSVPICGSDLLKFMNMICPNGYMLQTVLQNNIGANNDIGLKHYQIFYDLHEHCCKNLCAPDEIKAEYCPEISQISESTQTNGDSILVLPPVEQNSTTTNDHEGMPIGNNQNLEQESYQCIDRLLESIHYFWNLMKQIIKVIVEYE